ncbi:MAG TPA: helix-turn-helix transcriptional regulator, partial [Burkholderiales bacterium]|nr:helix-turn-helix transcriptional regulator [Burkholderiales bacterium]
IRDQDNALPNPVPHRHQYFQIHVNLAGRTHHFLSGVVRSIEPGTLSFVQPYIAHFIPTVQDSRYFLINADSRFLFPGADFDPLDLNIRASLEVPELAPFQVQELLEFRLDGDCLREVERLCQEMAREDKARGFASTTLIRAALLRLVGLVGERYGNQIRAAAGWEMPHTVRRRTLSDLVKYLRRNLENPLSLKDAARAVRLSPTHLAHVIKKETGRTFLDLLTERRMERARELLVHTSLTIDEVGQRSGFPQLSHFSRRFKQLIGMAPGQFRRSTQV